MLKNLLFVAALFFGSVAHAQVSRDPQNAMDFINYGSSGGGGVTSVALTAPAFLTVTGSPVTSSGTLALSLASTTQNYVFVGPTSGSGVPTFRLLVAGDIPGTLNGASGTLTVQTSGGGFGTLLLGAAGNLTGMQLVASASLLTVQTGSGANGTLSALGGYKTASSWLLGSVLYGDLGLGTHGFVTFPAATTGAVAFSAATGTLTGTGFTFNGSLGLANSTVFTDTANGTAQITSSSGGFGTLLLGAAGNTTGVELISTANTLSIFGGAGAGSQINVAANTFRPYGGSSTIFTGAGLITSAGAGTYGQWTFPTSNTAAATFSSATGVVAGTAGFQFNAGVNMQEVVVAQAANIVLTAAQSGATVITSGSTALQTTLPSSPVIGLFYTVINAATAATTVTSGSSALVIGGSLGTGTSRTLAASSSVNVASATFMFNGTNWYMFGPSGTIT